MPKLANARFNSAQFIELTSAGAGPGVRRPGHRPSTRRERPRCCAAIAKGVSAAGAAVVSRSGCPMGCLCRTFR